MSFLVKGATVEYSWKSVPGDGWKIDLVREPVIQNEFPGFRDEDYWQINSWYFYFKASQLPIAPTPSTTATAVYEIIL